jgi:hypothetical protein
MEVCDLKASVCLMVSTKFCCWRGMQGGCKVEEAVQQPGRIVEG